MPKFTLAQVCGLTNTHIDTDFYLHHEVVPAFIELASKAQKAGFALRIASGFRDFFRQRIIWNSKFTGQRPVLDKASNPIDISTLSDIALIHAIMRWSALPTASRHHWGTDCDIYAENLLPNNTKLQLEPWEYEDGGHQYPLTCWLQENMSDFSFYLPYKEDLGGVAREPWHISYQPLAQQAENILSLPQLQEILADLSTYLPPDMQNQKADIEGIDSILHNLPFLYERYITNTNKD